MIDIDNDLPLPRLIRTREVLYLLSVNRDTLKKLIRDGEIPPPLLLGNNHRWDLEELLQHVRGKRDAK